MQPDDTRSAAVAGEARYEAIWTPYLHPAESLRRPDLALALTAHQAYRAPMDDDSDDGIDWAEVAWTDRELKGEAGCCDREHVASIRFHADRDPCPCEHHPQSYMHPAGKLPWPAP